MGQEALQNVLNTIMFKRQEQLAQEKLQKETEQNQAENKLKQQQIQNANDRLAEEQRQFDLTHKATQALNNLEVEKRRQDINKGITESLASGLPVEGDTEISRRTEPTSEVDENGKPLTNTFVRHNVNGFEFELPDADTLARLQAKRNLAVKLPEIKAKAKEDLAKAQDELINKLAIQREHDFAESKWQAAHDAARIAAANIAHAKGIEDVNTQPYLEGLRNGTLTRDDILKTFPKDKEIATAILNASTQAGINPVDNKTKDFLSKFKGTADVVGTMDQFLQRMPEQGRGMATIGGLLSSLTDPQLVNLENEMKGRATPIARGLAQETRTSVPEINRVMAGYLPSRYDTKEVAIKKRQDFVKDLQSTLASRIGNLSKFQQESLKKAYGLDSIPETYNAIPGSETTNVFDQFGIPVRKK